MFPAPYRPWKIFASKDAAGHETSRVFIAPSRYVQGPGALARMGSYLSIMNVRRVGILVSARGKGAQGAALVRSLLAAELEMAVSIFGGECSLAEIAGRSNELQSEHIDCLVAVGGGKCVDAGKAVAFRLGIPAVILPTLASNDAPCSALSVLYGEGGQAAGVEYYPASPAMVVVDTEVIAAAPARFLVAGMGDAMSTWYEARACQQNEVAVTVLGGRPTIGAFAMAEACARTLYKDGLGALLALANKQPNAALERVVEANTLLSGVGFESAGIAAAHGFAQAFTHLPHVHAQYLHGEMVAIGTLAQLMLESADDEARQVATFFAEVGLPVQLRQLGIDSCDTAAMETVVRQTLNYPYLRNMPQPVDAKSIEVALLEADRLGLTVTREKGDEAYRSMHAP